MEKKRFLYYVSAICLVIAFLLSSGSPISAQEGGAIPIKSGNPDAAISSNSLPVKLHTLVDGLVYPIEVKFPADGSGRMFIVQQTGQILIFDGQQLLPTPFLDLSANVACCGERGLLSVEFHPNYDSNGYFYVYYTYDTGTNSQPESRIARYSVSGNPDEADPNSEEILINFTQPYSNHNGGQLHFGPDGYLYISLGDGGSAGDPDDLAQDLSNFFGTILRIDVDSGSPYAVPSNNPFLEDPDNPDTLSEIYAYGLRNPWRFSFDRSTGDLLIGDVGQSNWEEINFLASSSSGGENYGWRCYEGNDEYNLTGCGDLGEYTFPVLEYEHTLGCAVTGGYVYRGSKIQVLQGKYLYGDYCSGRIWVGTHEGGDSWTGELLSNTNYQVTSFGEDPQGELYVTDYNFANGKVLKIVNDVILNDFDGDGNADPAKFYASTGTAWWLASSTDIWESAWLGSESFEYVPYSDFDGDGKTDPGKFSAANGTVWYIKSSNGAWEGTYLGTDTYTYVAGNDFDGDAKSDPTKLLPNGAIWYPKSSTGIWEGFWMGSEDFEYAAGSDFDGDGRSDPAKFIADPGVLWYWESSGSGWVGVFLGSDTYTYVSKSDFDGDGKTDPAKFYDSTDTVWWLKSSTGTWDAAYMGAGSYTFVGGNDFDGDGVTDPAKYDPGTGILSWLKSSTGTWDSADMGTDAYALVN